jgi:hypothetical protein
MKRDSNGCELDKNGDKTWKNSAGQYHRTDGPAVEFANGTKWWCINGKLHRLDGPAVECANGDKEWYINGKLHRIDGPAIERANGTKQWWFKGKKISEEEYNSNEFQVKIVMEL